MSIKTKTVVAAKSWGWRHHGRDEWAIQDATFEVLPGETILIVGASGSGKSTLLKGLGGLLEKQSGDEEGVLEQPGQVTATVLQDPDSQVVMDQIGDEVAFGLENLGVDVEAIWPRVSEALARVGLDLPLDHSTAKLSGGQKQRLALACAYAMEAEVLLLDEPTANLDPGGAKQVKEALVQNAAELKQTVILVEHRLDLWRDFAKRIIVLDGGKIVADGPVAKVLDEQQDYLREIGIWLPGDDTLAAGSDLVACTSTPAETAVTARNLKASYDQKTPANETPVNLDLERGGALCMVGENGAGKTALALTLAGLLPPLEGKVQVNGTSEPYALPSRELPAAVGMVFQEPAYQFVRGSVIEELRLGAKQRGRNLGFARETDDLVQYYLKKLGLEHLSEAHPATLSGGEKRRLAVATAIIAAPPVLVLDEPTFGQDRNTWLTLVQLILELRESGTLVVAVTHDEAFVEAIGAKTYVVEGQRKNAAKEPAIRESRLNPLTKLLMLLVMTLPLLASIDIASATIALILESVLLFATGNARHLRRLWPLLLVSPLTGISLLLYGKPSGQIFWHWGPATISESSVTLAVAMLLRVLAVGGPAVVIASNLRGIEVADALVQIAKWPTNLVLGAFAGMRLSALMISDWRGIERGRRSRGLGGNTKGGGHSVIRFFGSAFTLLVLALRRAGVLSLTMQARGFGRPVKRSYARQSKLSYTDLLALLLAVLLPVTALGLSAWLGYFAPLGMRL